MKNKKLDVHLVEHTHWDREWYFTSDDSRTMLYYDMKFMINHLENNEDKFTYDGQSSIIDDFLKFSPEWKERLENVVRSKKLYVGPFYTAVDDTVAAGESISRNLEMGKYIAEKIGHSMEVGYLPDTFGHNNQIPQILSMSGINNLSFYRGIDPEKINDKLYFKYKGQDGTEILGHWQTHYTTKGFGPSVKEGQYTEKWFEDNILADYTKKGDFSPSVKSYEKRNYNLPISIPIGTDQRPFSKKMPALTKKMNEKYEKYNFINSSYEDFIKDVAKQIKDNKIDLPIIESELRVSKTGRVHRTVASSRMDIKQLHFELEQVLINILEPMSIMCHMNKIDVPWKMIEDCWKSLHKSSAHDSYACSNEDPVNRKLKLRLWNSIRIARGVIAMLSRIYSSKLISEKDDKYSKLIVFNYKHNRYKGSYQFITTLKKDFEKGNFKILDGDKEIKYSILNRNKMGTHERNAIKLLLHNVEIESFNHKILDIKYDKDNNDYVIDKNRKIAYEDIDVSVNNDSIDIKINDKKYTNLINVAFDASIGDTYDHSPITFNDKKYLLSNFKILERIEKMNTIRFEGSALIPSGIDNWKENKPSIEQKVVIQISIVNSKLHIHIKVKNKADNARMIFLVNAITSSEEWYHDQQFGIYKRNMENEYMKNWDKIDSLGYTWQEYPTNLSPFQSFVSNNESNLTVYASGTKEHEMINFNGENTFAFTLYRAFGKFGTKNVAYRPGRASGANCDAPDSQLIDQTLKYQFIVDLKKVDLKDQFIAASEMHMKNFYIPSEWALHRTILRWNTDIGYYDGDLMDRNFTLKLPKDLINASIVTSSIYRRLNGDVIVRLLNIGKNKIINSDGIKISRDLKNFNNDNIELPSFGLINVLLEKGTGAI